MLYVIKCDVTIIVVHVFFIFILNSLLLYFELFIVFSCWGVLSFYVCSIYLFIYFYYHLLFFQFVAGMYKNGQLPEVQETEPWVDDSFWEIKRSNNAIVDEAYKQFSGTN